MARVRSPRAVRSTQPAVWASKRVANGVDDGVITSDEPGWSRTMREIGGVLRSEDAKEGPRAFAEKRAPVWQAK